MAVKLSQLEDGQEARVRDVDATDPTGHRVLEMGVTPGIVIRRLGSAPLGDPIEFEVRGYHLSLRRVEAERVEVETLGD